MQGEVYVYSPIGGMNMENKIAAADMTGSNMDGGEESSLRVSWELPGGIVNAPHGYDVAAWGYLFESGVDISDTEMYERLAMEGYAQLEEDGTYTITNETEAHNFINGHLNMYVDRLMQYSLTHPDAGTEDPLSLNSFFKYFMGCASYV